MEIDVSVTEKNKSIIGPTQQYFIETINWNGYSMRQPLPLAEQRG
jgi:hypothetical protein